jgi:flagellar basal-body rod protein FlgF
MNAGADMDNLSILVAGGLKTRIDALDVLANNIANASTPGYKADREFYSVYASADALENAQPELVPDVSRKWTDFSQGALAQTGNPLDLGISGKGFFAVKSGAGTLLTRNGSFRLSPTGELQTSEGHPVSGLDGQPIRVDPREPCTIGADGTITQGSRAIGKLDLVDVSEPQSLAKEASGYFRLSDTATMRKAAAGSSIQQGRLEGSNISPAEAAVRLVSVLRQFEMLQRAASIGAEMNRHAVEEVARVNS